MNKQALIALAKSAGRFVWFGLLGLVVVALTAVVSAPEIVTATINVGGFNVSVGFVIVAVIGSLTKAIDVYIHKNSDIDLNGIAPSFLQK